MIAQKSLNNWASLKKLFLHLSYNTIGQDKMNQDSISKCFSNPYDRATFLELLRNTFSSNAQILAPPLENKDAPVYLGKLTLSNDDHKNISLFEMQIEAGTQLHRNRVHLRNIIAKEMKTEGALAVYFDPKNPQKWRLSFVSIEGEFDKNGQFFKKETAPKRYTYLLGKDEKVKTAIKQFYQLKGSSTLDDFKEAFAVEPLNKEFYQKLYNWYKKAGEQVTFPNDEKINHATETALIRLLTRLLFVWFLKQKDLINSDFFKIEKIKQMINYRRPSSYYKAILQNLFFATINRKIGDRSFRRADKNGNPNGNNYGVTNIYRYQDYFVEQDQAKIVALFEKTPFLNGGLFECLDREANDKEKEEYQQNIRGEATKIRMDGFSDRASNCLNIPNSLFFNKNKEGEDLALIELLEQYQFTVDESTANDVDVALEPELLGRVFENLLGIYNPETREQARKATGSFYTPREIVSFMVDESLQAYFSDKTTIEKAKLEKLFKEFKEDKEPILTELEQKELVSSIYNLSIIDPAVGSGAFPMGILQRLTAILEKIDPENKHWETQQIQAAEKIPDENSRAEAIKAIKKVFSSKNTYNAYGRKLYLIQNCIYGVDIQSIAIQICKLRFFISLAIEQEPNQDQSNNYGIKALPNLETKFISTDALLKLPGLPGQKNTEQKTIYDSVDEQLKPLKEKLEKVRTEYFNAKTAETKKKYREEDKKIRQKIKEKLKNIEGATSEQLDIFANKIADWDPYNQSASADWFEPKWQFGIQNGFDIVIGNPPYIQLQKEAGKLAKMYKSQAFSTFASSGDIYCLFYERGNQLLKNEHGNLCFITSNKWMRAGYGQKLRDYFVENTSPQILLDLGPDVFESATVDTNILLFKKERAKTSHTIQALTIKEKGHAQQLSTLKLNPMPLYAKGDSWAILSPIERKIKEKMERIGTPLKDWDISIYRGIVTGFNEAFIIDGKTKDALIAQDPKSDEIIKPILRGKDIKRYQANFADKWIDCYAK